MAKKRGAADQPLDTSEDAQAARIAAMAARLKEAGVERVSELSTTYFDRAVKVDGVAGRVAFVSDDEARVGVDLEDGRRVWIETAELGGSPERGFTFSFGGE